MADDEPQVPEGLLTLHKSTGTVTAVIKKETHTLRRPTIGELRKLREVLWEIQDRLEKEGAPLTEARKRLSEAREKAKDDEGDAGTEALVAVLEDVARLNRRWQEVTEDSNLEWMQAAFDMLGDADPPAKDDMPIWAAQTDTVTTLLDHWRTYPLALGVD